MSNEDKFGALYLLVSSAAGREVEVITAHGYHIVTFAGTTANLMFDTNDTTIEEIREVIREAMS